MKRFYLFILFVLASSLTNVCLAGNESDWEFISEDSGIKMYERWIVTKSEQKVRERTGKMTINCDAQKVIDLIADEKRTHLWMNNVESVKMLKHLSAEHWIQRTVLDAPWPFNKQDMVSDYTVTKTDKLIVIKITPANNEFPCQKGIERLDTFVAKWEIEPAGKNNVKVTFTTTSTIPPKYPAMVQDPVVRKVFVSNLRNFKKLIQQS